jgi:hypothetical protein
MVRTSSLVTLLFAVTLASQAQPPAPPSKLAPTLNILPLSGAQRGASVEMTLTGTNLADVTGVWASFPMKASILESKSPTAAKVKIEVAKDAPIGVHFLRVATLRGISNVRPFCIDALPEVAEAATNRELKSAQAVPVPCVVAGKADVAEATDYFKVSVKAGQRLSFEVLGRRLGSGIDPQLTLLDSKGNEIPGGFSNDAPGLQTDPRLTMTFKEAGDVIVAVRDVSYRAGGDYHYRLRIGDFPCATAAIPMGIKRGTKAKLSFAGPSVEGVAPVEVQAPDDPSAEVLHVAPVGASGLPGWPAAVAVSPLDEQVEKEPNDEPAKANRVAIPSAITGRFEKKDDVDHYVFTAKKGQRVVIEAHTAELGSPTDVHMTLRDAKGGQLMATNPTAAARLDFTAGADGDFTLAVEHLHSWGGPDEAYRVTFTPYAPDFSLTLAIDRFEVAPGGEVGIPVYLQQQGYNGAVEVAVEGPKGVVGTGVIPAGPPRAPNVPGVTLQVKAEDLPPGPHMIRIRGKADINGQAVTRYASTRALLTAAMANLPFPPRDQYARVGLAITEKPPFAVTARPDAPEAQGGKSVQVTITVTRRPEFKGEVAVTLAAPSPGVTVAPGKVAADKGEVKVEVKLAPTVKPGPLALSFQGSAKHEGRDYTFRAPPLSLMIKK